MSLLEKSQIIEPLPFRVAPHMLEDLGLNLYSSLPRVLVEFVANAYDADATTAEVSMDFELIRRHRSDIKAEWIQQKTEHANSETAPAELADRLLPDDAVISIQDDGHGMSIEQLRNRFLVAGRRRRKEERTNRSLGQRILMGRKGVGKLAGFGVARRIEVISKSIGTDQAHGIRLDFDTIMMASDTSRVQVPTFRLPDDAGLGPHGSRVTLSRLVHESVKSQEQTVRQGIADHFVLIDKDDFAICLNGTTAKPTPREFAYSWPADEHLGIHDLASRQIPIPETDGAVEFQYRLRFVQDRSALRASERGVRVYAHKRLASAPSLLNADTNMHGFRMTDYLDGVVHADFIDEYERDYIATDRQGLRWDTPVLQPVHQFLSEQIKEACKQYQKVRDEAKVEEVQADPFTKDLIDAAQLSSREKKLARVVCAKLASFHGQGVATPAYKQHAQLLVGAIGKGEIFTAISEIADLEAPQLHDLTIEVTKLTRAEIDQMRGVMRSRVVAIETLQRIVEGVDFRRANKESELHTLLKQNPWLIDPTYFEFLSSNRASQTMFSRLEKELEIGAHRPVGYDNTSSEEILPLHANLRPDLVFLLGNQSLRRVVIVELKAPNTPLLDRHLTQLQDYMADTKSFLSGRQRNNVSVEGCLIGSLDLSQTEHREIERLSRKLDERGVNANWAVYDLMSLFERTCNAHKELLAIHDELEDESTGP